MFFAFVHHQGIVIAGLLSLHLDPKGLRGFIFSAIQRMAMHNAECSRWNLHGNWQAEFCQLIIGKATTQHPRTVVMKTVFGGLRIVDMLVGEQLPRIC